MKHQNRHIDGIITKYLDGSASEKEYSELYRYLKKNKENIGYFVEIKDLWLYNTAIWQPVKITLSAFEKLKERIGKFIFISRIKRTAFYISQLTAILIIAVILFPLKEQKIGPDPDISNHTVITSAQRSEVTLPDGTVVWLNDSSKLIYPGHFSTTDRQVFLEGEAWFNVIRDEAKPFIAKSDHQEIRVLGTSFNIRNRRNDNRITTTLISGSVSVRFDNDTSHTVTLAPNEQITFTKSSGSISKDTVPALGSIVWATGKMVFNNDKFSDVISYLENKYRVRVIYPVEIADTLRLTLIVRNEPKEEIFKEIARISHLRYDIQGKTVYLMLPEKN